MEIMDETAVGVWSTDNFEQMSGVCHDEEFHAGGWRVGVSNKLFLLISDPISNI